MLIRIALLLLAPSPPHRRFGKSETFRDLVRIRVPVTAADAAARRITLKVTSQGCSDKGVCYVPLEQLVSVACLMRSRAFVLCAALFGMGSAAWADEAAVRAMVQEKLRGNGEIQSVRGREGLQIYYVDERASIIISGQAIDAKSGCNLTAERERELNKVKWESLPLQWAMPFAVLGPKSTQQAKAVWCSKDRVKAWNELMFRRVEPQATADCDNPIDKLAQFGRSIGANATPTWFLPNGERTAAQCRSPKCAAYSIRLRQENEAPRDPAIGEHSGSIGAFRDTRRIRRWVL